jgi:hypothetical protein
MYDAHPISVELWRFVEIDEEVLEKEGLMESRLDYLAQLLGFQLALGHHVALQ